MSISEQEHRLIGDIYDAALEPTLWPATLDHLSRYCPSKGINLVVSDALNPDYLIVHSHGTDPDVVRGFQERNLFHLEKASTQAWIDQGIGLGEAHANHQLFGSIQNYIKAMGDFYTECMIPMDTLWMVGMALEMTDYRYATIGFHRSPGQDAYSDAEVAMINRFAPHLRRAMQIHRQMTLVREHNAQLYQMLGRMVAGVMLLDTEGRVRFANPAAEELLRCNHPTLFLSAQQKPRTGNAQQSAELEQFIQGAISIGLRSAVQVVNERYKSGGVIGLQRADTPTPLMLTITPLSGMSGYASLAADGIAASIFLSDPDAPRSLAHSLLQRHYLFTERECDFCETFVNCASLEGVAELTGLSILTVRSYLRDIFEKTSMHSQAELMRLLLGLTIEFDHIR